MEMPPMKQIIRIPCRFFTLIELLLVISVIIILLGLLLPALSHAKETAKGIACVNNMKQIGIGLANYTLDFDGLIPSARLMRTAMPTDSDGYFTREVTICPGIRHKLHSSTWSYNPITFERSTKACSGQHFFEGGIVPNPNKPVEKLTQWCWVRPGRCKTPSDVANLADASVANAWGVWTTGHLIWGAARTLDDEGNLQVGGHASGGEMQGAEGRCYRHHQNSPALFFDYHVESSRYPQTSCHQHP